MKPTKCPAREKKMRQEKRKKKGGQKAKSESQDCCVTFKPKKKNLSFLSSFGLRTYFVKRSKIAVFASIVMSK